MVIEMLDRKLFGQFLQGPDMIAVKMRSPKVIDAADASTAQRLCDSGKVPLTRIAGVDEHRLASGPHKECGLAAFGVDVVDFERAATFGGRADARGHEQRQSRNDTSHERPPDYRRVCPSAAKASMTRPSDFARGERTDQDI